MTMKKIALYENLPVNVRPPFRFREAGKGVDGEVDSPIDIIKMFEPIDVLNGVLEVVDADSNIMRICTDDISYLKTNEYPSVEKMFMLIEES